MLLVCKQFLNLKCNGDIIYVARTIKDMFTGWLQPINI